MPDIPRSYSFDGDKKPSLSQEELRNCSKTLEEFKLWIFWAENFLHNDPKRVIKEYQEMADNDKWMLCTLVPVGSHLDQLLWGDLDEHNT